MKIIAFYLPQFHEIAENSEWWGRGFTEWTNVRKAKPLFEGHEQPRLPLDGNFYDLTEDSVKTWQASIAKKYGVYGFCYYHYWFNGRLLLEKPMEQMLANPDIDMPFCVCWANEAWTRAWTGGKEVLIPQMYGGRDEWAEHFNYLLPFFLDSRYIKEDGKPLVVIYRPEVIGCLPEMLAEWRKLALEAGLPGILFAYQQVTYELTAGADRSLFDFNIEFQPLYSMCYGKAGKPWYKKLKVWDVLRRAKRVYYNKREQLTGVDLDRQRRSNNHAPTLVSYDDVWADVLTLPPVGHNSIPGCYVGWDNTPRHGTSGWVHTGSSPEKFRTYMRKMIARARADYNSEYLFLTAWNEWAEGCVLEPDDIHGYGYLEALRDALTETGEFPSYEGA